jgi:hypothetical protein
LAKESDPTVANVVRSSSQLDVIVRMTISLRSRAHEDLLTKIYRHSPVNTSPAFALPNSIAVLEIETTAKADELKASIIRLQKVKCYLIAI